MSLIKKNAPARNRSQVPFLNLSGLTRYAPIIYSLLIGCLIAPHSVMAQQSIAKKNISTPQPPTLVEKSSYFIPGFSRELIKNNYIIYQDLQIAKHAANHHDILRLRIALADANGHLLQMDTPPSLAGLRDQLVAVSEQLNQSRKAPTDPNWESLFSSIRQLPMPSVYASARNRLEATAQRAQTLAESGHLNAARLVITDLISDIEITAHIYPTTQLRDDIQKAILESSYDNPRWTKTLNAISEASKKTQWLFQSVGQNLIKAYDATVAAYIEWPKSIVSRASLRLAHRYLDQTRQTQGLANQFLVTTENSPLSLATITRLETAVELFIHHSRTLASSAGN